MKVIYVHGIAQEGRKPEELRTEWDAALRLGLKRAGLSWPESMETAMTYYGDTLAQKTADADRAEALGLIPKGKGDEEDAERLAFFDAYLREVASARGVAVDNLVGEDGKPIPKGVQNWKVVTALVRKLNEVRPLADLSIDLFTRDVFVYLRYNFVRKPVHDEVEPKIPSDVPCVLVSHSLGTVVAYNILMGRSDRRNVREWITLGSPLGIKAVYDRLPSAGGARKAPLGVPAWYNARDVDDIVALHPVPANRFNGTPVVENANHVDNPTSNEHGISGYLSDAEVARRIHTAATSI